MDAGLDSLLITPDRIQTMRQLTGQAREFLVHLGGPSGSVPAQWLTQRGVGGPAAWSDDLDLQPVLRIAETFAEFLSGGSETAATPGPALFHQIREQSPAGPGDAQPPSAGMTEPDVASPSPVWAIAANVVEHRLFGPVVPTSPTSPISARRPTATH